MTTRPDRRRFSIVALMVLGSLSLLVSLPWIFRGVTSNLSLPATNVSAATRDSFSLSAPLVLLETPRLVLEQGTISLTGQEGVKPSNGEALFSLLTGGVADLVLDNAVLTVDAAAQAAPSAAAPGADAIAPVVRALSSLAFDTLTLHDGTIVIRRAGGAEERVTNVNADVVSKRAVSLRAKGTGRFRGEKLIFDAALSSLNAKAGTPMPIRAYVQGEYVTANVEGHLRINGMMQLTASAAEVDVPNIRKTARWLGAILPAGQGLGSLKIRGPLEWSKSVMAFEGAAIALDGNTARGGLSVTIGADNKPALEGTLAFESLDLAPYIAIDQTSSGMSSLVSDWLPAMRLPGGHTPSLINEIDADLRISAANVNIGGLALGRCAATASIKDGKFIADLAEIDLEAGGNGEAQITVDATGSTPHYAIRGKVESLDLGKTVGAYFGRPVLEGIGTLALDLTAGGTTGPSVLDSIAGSVSLDMPDGARLGVDIPGIALAADSVPKEASWSQFQGQATSIDNLVARFSATSGVFTAQALSAGLGEKDLVAAGAIDVSRRALDLTVSLARPSSGAPISEANSNGSFRIYGPWQAPAITAVPPLGKSAAPATPDLTPAAPGPDPAERG